MEQRSLRLGDIVDDYCPRERRVTNHAIVAIVEDAIRLTRCTTCDHEHQFKGAREPRRRTKTAGALYHEVLADVTGGQLVPPSRVGPAEQEPIAAAGARAAETAPDATPEETTAPAPPEDGWPAHRTLIRATLPRTTGEPPPPRPIPEFTMHQPPPRPRGRGFRFGHGQPSEPFGNSRHGRPDRGPRHQDWNAGPRNGNGNGNTADRGNGNAPGKARRRRRGGKRNRS